MMKTVFNKNPVSSDHSVYFTLHYPRQPIYPGHSFFNSHQPLDVQISVDFCLTITPTLVEKLHDRVNVRRAAGSLRGFPVTSAV